LGRSGWRGRQIRRLTVAGMVVVMGGRVILQGRPAAQTQVAWWAGGCFVLVEQGCGGTCGGVHDRQGEGEEGRIFPKSVLVEEGGAEQRRVERVTAAAAAAVVIAAVWGSFALVGMTGGVDGLAYEVW